MKLETIILRTLLVACMTVCALILGAMLAATPSGLQFATDTNLRTLLLATPIACPLPADGILCPSPRS